MNWHTDKSRREAMSAEGYCIRWSTHATRGIFYNAWSPSGAHIEASHDRDKCKRRCEEHLTASIPQLELSAPQLRDA